MPEFHVGPTDTTPSGGTGTSIGSKLKGLKAFADAVAATTIKAGDTVNLYGTFNHAEVALGWPNAVAAGTGLTNLGTGQGPTIGTAQGFLSAACGITVNFRTSEGQAVIDMSGASQLSERMSYALLLRGEDINILYPKVKSSRYNYMQNRVAGTPESNQQPETISYENIPLALHGSGTIIGADLDGGVGTGFARYGLHILVSTDTMSANHSKWKKIKVVDPLIRGCFHNLRVDPGGPGSSGSSLKEGCTLEVINPTLLDPWWGGELAAKGGNAATHGGMGSIAGNWKGRGFVRDGLVRGYCQDAFDLVTTEFTMLYTEFQDLDGVDPTAYVWNGSAWVPQLVIQRLGNGVKAGLTGLDGTAPTAWNGVDGVAGGSGSIPEAGNHLIGVKVYRSTGYGITTNGAKGLRVSAAELVDNELGCFGAIANSGNYLIHDSFLRLKDTAARVTLGSGGALVSPACIDSYASTKGYLYNNVFDAQYAASGVSAPYRREISGGSALPFVNSKNVLVTGQINGSGYTAANDVNGGAATSIPDYVVGAGFPGGSSFHGMSDMAAYRIIRAHLMNRDPSGKLVRLGTPGPWGRI